MKAMVIGSELFLQTAAKPHISNRKRLESIDSLAAEWSAFAYGLHLDPSANRAPDLPSRNTLSYGSASR